MPILSHPDLVDGTIPFDKRGANLIANRNKSLTENCAAMPTKYTDVKGHATYFHYHGATTLPDVIPNLSRGRKIVFVHGAGGNGHPWHNQIERLGAGHSPVAFDLPGHGRSAGVEGLKS